MSLLETLADEIFAEPQFGRDLRRLEREKLRAEFARSSVSVSKIPEDWDYIRRLLQSALVFASSPRQADRRLAQRIATGTKLLGKQEDPTIDSLFTIIAGRLRNFPSLASVAGGTNLEGAPWSLRLEFVQRMMEQTVRSSDGSEKLLSPFQIAAWKALRSGASTALSAPTSAGKSYVLLAHVVDAVSKERLKVVYVVPTRALINQVAGDIRRETERRGVLVEITSVPVDLSGKERAVYVLTQERLELLLLEHPNAAIDLVIVDEAQTIGQETRGVILEAVLDRLLGREKPPQFVFIGPTIENPDYFGRLFGLDGFVSCATTEPAVTQNIVYADCVSSPKSEVVTRIELDGIQERVEAIPLDIILQTDDDRLSHLSVLLGSADPSIVYANGRAEAEKVAIKIADQLPDDGETLADLAPLIRFVRRHVHKDYALATTLEKGVAFHYGYMPSLLRAELEQHFKDRRLRFLVCTSTLLYGLNLPAKNIFLLRPKAGEDVLAGPDFWNLVGRAGRLGHELEGNVYLIDYDRWGRKPVAESGGLQVKSALGVTLTEKATNFLDYINQPQAAAESDAGFELALGKLVLDHRAGKLERTVERYGSRMERHLLENIVEGVERVSHAVALPKDILDRSIGVPPLRQLDLYEYFVKRIVEKGPAYVIPARPTEDFKVAEQSYRQAFKRIHTYLLNYPGKDKRHTFFAPLALRWMRGEPLPVLIDSAIRHARKQGKATPAATLIRRTMEDVEEDLRFRYVKFFTCYNALLVYALGETGFVEFVDTVPDIPLFLEMGGSSGAMINLMALGLSRTSAEAVNDYFTDKDLDLEQVKGWLVEHRGRFGQYEINEVCVQEIEALAGKLSDGSGHV